jgi:hypothetical protein
VGVAVLFDLHAPMAIPADSQRIADHVRAVGEGRERGPVGIAISREPEQFRLSLTYAEMTKKTAPVEVLLTPAQRAEWMSRNARRRPK